MPELPEVETVKRGLKRLIIARKVKSLEVRSDKSFIGLTHDVDKYLIGATITDVRRRAKVVIIDLSTNCSLVTHLKMTGQLVFIKDQDRFGAGHPTDSLVGELPDKSTRIILEFTDGSHLYFNDQRKFGWMRLIATNEVMNIDFMKRVGPEPLEDDFTAKQFIERFRKHQLTTIKAALLNQSVIAGVGNIYADESLWGAKIHPASKVGDLTDKQLARLYKEVREVMKLSIEKGGSTNRNYVNAEGKRGSYMDFARVFRREGLDCPRCGGKVIKIRVAGRGTHICPKCQKIK